MNRAYDIAGFRRRIGAIRFEDNPVLVKQKSRDFYWYSPVLKRELDAVTADIVVSPTSEAEVAEVLAAAYELGIPVTPRGSGTGNYGQAMPLTGGVLLNLADMNRVLSIHPGRVVCEPGVILADVDKATRASGQELRMFPSTRNTASVAGFVAGGSGGVGSITWGGLRDFGNVLRLRVLTMESSPRALELTGEDLHKAVHAYGTNGIITEVEMPLTAAYDWADVIVGFEAFDAAMHYAMALSQEDGLLKKLVTVVASPAPHDFFLRHRSLIPKGRSVVILMIAPHALDAFRAFTRPFSGAEILLDSSCDSEATLKGLPPNYELTWNHTTLHALKIDKHVTYLQSLFPADRLLAAIAEIEALLGDRAMAHYEFLRYNGTVTAIGLPLVRFTDAASLRELIALHIRHGVLIADPHVTSLEAGSGHMRADIDQLGFKHEADPLGLMNPGKMTSFVARG